MSIRTYIKDWIKFLTIPRKEFNGMSTCPHAAQAVYAICTVEDGRDLEVLLPMINLIPYHVLIIEVLDPVLAHLALQSTREVLARHGLLALPSNPANPTIIAGFRTTQLEHYLVIVQRKDELERASRQMKQKGYYHNWTPEQLAWTEDRH
jgi:hypothetical protein